MSKLKVIISGGGTGGHIFPAIAIANALKEKNPETEILFVGARGKMEMEKVPKAGYEIVGLPIRGIQRKLSLRNFMVPFLLIRSFLISISTIRKFKPDVLVGVGGYASGVIVYTGSFMGKKTLIQEQNSYPGITNKILSKRVDKVCVAFDNMNRFFPENKIKLLGNPIRKDILTTEGKKDQGLKHFNLRDDRVTVLAVGGSLGARTINRSIWALRESVEKLNIQVIWQCGATSAKVYQEKLEQEPNEHLHLHPFITEMDLAYAAADLVISRAGALAISEIAALRKASILIPSPNVSEDHQTKNAKALSDKNGAILLPDTEAEPSLAKVLEDLLSDKKKIEDLISNLDNVYSNVKAAEDIANEITKLSTS